MSTSRKKTCSGIIYFDNNATTIINSNAKKIHAEWLGCYNAASDSKVAKPAKQQLERATDSILAHCGVSSATHTAIFTSGATESNCLIIKSCVKAYKRKLIERGSELKPHVVTSALEHHSIMECLHDLQVYDDIDVTYVQPTIYGNILPSDIKDAILPNTCLVTIMFANNEIPVINNLNEIGAIAHEKRIPVHSDCVQIFGKYKINMETHNIDALSASAHKFYGPKGVGILIINNKLIEGYGLTAEIHGSQQYGLRGGTENIAGISSMMAALKHTFNKRQEKNKKLYKLRSYMLESLAELFPMGQYLNYLAEKPDKHVLELVSLGPPDNQKGFILPNTILLSIAKNKGKPFCNIELKKLLDARNIVVSIGSACLTSSKSSSHVLSAIGAPPVVKRGVIRISFSDNNTIDEINKFCKIFKECVLKQCADIDVSSSLLVKSSVPVKLDTPTKASALETPTIPSKAGMPAKAIAPSKPGATTKFKQENFKEESNKSNNKTDLLLLLQSKK